MSADTHPVSRDTPSPMARFDAMVRALSPDDRPAPGPTADRWPAVPEREPVTLDDSLRRALEVLHDHGRP